MLRPYGTRLSVVPEGWGVLVAIGAGSLLLSAGGAVISSRAMKRRRSCQRTVEGDDIVLRVKRGSLPGARPLMLVLRERVGQGRRCGLRRLSREMGILLPAGSRVEVARGERVTSGESLLATLLRKS